MLYLFANFDKKQYILPTNLNAPHGRKQQSMLHHSPLEHLDWMRPALELLEANAGPSSLATNPLSGSWAGDRVAIIHHDDQTGRCADPDEVALAALAGKGYSTYDFVRKNFENITNQVRATRFANPATLQASFQRLASDTLDFKKRDPLYSYIAATDASRYGRSYFDQFIDWLRANQSIEKKSQRLAIEACETLDMMPQQVKGP